MRGDKHGWDERIDAALRSYAEPREVTDARVAAARILERAREAQAPSRRWGWILAPAAVCLLLVAVAGVVVSRQVRHVPKMAVAPKAAQSLVTGRKEEGTAHALGAGIREQGHAVRARVRSCAGGCSGARAARVERADREAAGETRDAEERELPKLAVFPTPAPLSPQERRLVAVVRKTPENDKIALAGAAKQPGDLPAVATFRIRPLLLSQDAGEKQESAKEGELP